MPKPRLEDLVVERGMAASVEEARRIIMAGEVFSGTNRMMRPGEATAADTPLEHRPPDPWVSRGAHKLLAALDAWPSIRVAGRTVIDLGASTGGFTHVLLERGAARVWAVDVGKGVLDARLRADSRVTVCEETNARGLAATMFENERAPSLLVADLSFVSLRAVLPGVLPLLVPEPLESGPVAPEAVVLLKPQFEAERHEVKRGGVVRDAAVRARLRDEFKAWEPAPGWRCAGLIPSPLKGPAGNTEYLLHYRSGAA